MLMPAIGRFFQFLPKIPEKLRSHCGQAGRSRTESNSVDGNRPDAGYIATQ
jgi:hypothetical protein